MKGTVEKHGNRWRLQFWYLRQRYRRSIAAAGVSRRDAERMLDTFIAEVKLGRIAPGRTPTVSDVLAHLQRSLVNRGIKSPKFYASHIRTLDESLGHLKADRLSASDIETHKERRLGAGRKPATVNRDLQVLRQAFRLAVRQRILLEAPPFDLLREDNARQGFVDDATLRRIVAGLEARKTHEHGGEILCDAHGDFTLWAFLSAWRRGEIRNLQWESVDRGAREVRLATTKSGKPRTLALEGELAEIIERRWAKRAYTTQRGKRTHLSRYVFHVQGKPIGNFRDAWSEATRAAGVPGLLFHDLRRSAIRELRKAGVAESVAMSISGHRTNATFKRYDIVDTEDQRRAIRERATATRGSVVSLKSGDGGQ